jgi:uncharacterized protein (UPF0333 family)
MAHLFLFLFSLLVLADLYGAHVVEYNITNRAETTLGGTRFNNELDVEYTRQTMVSATNFIWDIFHQSTEADRKSYKNVKLFVVKKLSRKNQNKAAEACGPKIKVDARHRVGYQVAL